MTDTPEPKRVFAQIARPTPGNPLGIVTEGMYLFADGVVTLVDKKGRPVKDADGKTYKLPVGDNHPDVIACILTRKFRLARRGKNAPTRGFSGPINYPSAKWIV